MAIRVQYGINSTSNKHYITLIYITTNCMVNSCKIHGKVSYSPMHAGMHSFQAVFKV